MFIMYKFECYLYSLLSMYFLKSYGTKDLENNCRCFSIVWEIESVQKVPSLMRRRIIDVPVSYTWADNKTHYLKRQDPLDFSFWSFGFTFLHHGIDEVERHLLWTFQKKNQRKIWANVPPKLLACLRFLYKVVHKICCLRKFNRAQKIELNFFYRLDYLYETWHPCSSCSWLQPFASYFFNFCLGT